MTETPYGPGRSAWTPADAPSAPVITQEAPESLDITPGADENGPHAEYAILNETAGSWLDASGGDSATPVWKSRTGWGTVRATGLATSVSYTFRLKARSGDGTETGFGPSAAYTVGFIATDERAVIWGVAKASSTVTAPAFMDGLPTIIRLGGKSLNDFGFHPDRITGLDLPRVVPDEELVPGGLSWRVHDEYFAPKRIVMEGYVHGSSPGDMRLRLAYLKSFISTFDGSPWRSCAPVILERSDMGDRHWRAFYEAVEEVEPIGGLEHASSARVRVSVKCPEPFAFSNDVTRVMFTPSGGSFHAVDLGNAPSDAVHVIRGPASNPSFTVGDMVFLTDFSDGLSFRDVQNELRTGACDPPGVEAAAWRTTETGMGILVSDGLSVCYTARGNPRDGSWVLAVEPQWSSSGRAADATVFTHRADADNFIRLYWRAADRAWVFLKRAGGVDVSAISGPQAFTAGTRVVLGISYDATNAGGMKLFVDGAQAGADGSTAALHKVPQEIILHANDSAERPDTVFGFIAGWSRMLSADEMLRIARDQSTVRNRNVTVSWAGTLDTGDLLSLDSAEKTATLFDVSTGLRTNALAAVTGDIPSLAPGRRRTATDRTQTMVWCGTAMGGMEIRYRRRYL